ncbi:hypothetical protein BB734_00525 [Mycobacterium avium subsp. hominissuis]|uniref:Uncharacterized protein n=4 Tax=Mycobacterium avium complex (MAC) TaxID=120793 RepID=A0A2A3LB87_MYCAV|nr:hypothetical protein DFS55_17680 [Mycobacterium avium subsp. hominissuis]ETA93479.1 hypothetical protein O984_08915 [Mycobacterium avium 05-4293]ETB26679.1 hypothetical protein O983_07530 [Mycobacterium avium 09-5983]ETB42754.1 hypothetical protein N602_07095 [Mycobacterium avium subsp. hominissuis 10-5606]KDP01048.1 hypothetical protein MAV3388_07150 [Mycobacterium avium subsp. hominissuis 3388]ORA56249.1 hypothetical protein BST19_05085 [Mycobacterium bouchedurhonense]ORB81887.1 hypothet
MPVASAAVRGHERRCDSSSPSSADQASSGVGAALVGTLVVSGSSPGSAWRVSSSLIARSPHSGH